MRVLLAAGTTAAMLLIACGGCSSTKLPSLPKFGSKDKGTKSSSTALAPPAPQFNSMAGQSPSVSMPQSSSTWSNLPVYPGTNYQQTPYPEQAITAGAVPGYSSYAGAPAANAPTAYGANYGSMPPSAENASGPTSPYASTYPAAGGQASGYAAAGAPPNAQQQQPPAYGAAPQAQAYGTQAPAYTAQQAPAYGAATQPYAPPATAPQGQQQQPASPYGQPPAAYGSPADPYGTQDPYGTYQR